MVVGVVIWTMLFELQAGGMPQMTPDMASMAANMMSSMTPEDMQRMQQMASQMGGGGAGMMGGPGEAAKPGISSRVPFFLPRCRNSPPGGLQQQPSASSLPD